MGRKQLLEKLLDAHWRWKCGDMTSHCYDEKAYVEARTRYYCLRNEVLEKMVDWIPLAEGLPEPNETVEIWLPNNSYVKIAVANFHILGIGVKVFSGVTTYSLKEVSHFRRIVGPREEDG